jgi:hypothetical protein
MTERAHITLVVDRSSSMSMLVQGARTRTDGKMMNRAREADEGIKTFLDEQRDLDMKITVSRYDFDDKFEHTFGPVKLRHVPDYKIEPRGSTSLFDAIGFGIVRTREMIDDLADDKRPSKVVVLVATDGEENTSREHTFDSITKLIEERKKDGWEFVFIAGSLETAKMAQQSGLRGQTISINPNMAGQTQTAYRMSGAATSSYLSGKAAGVVLPEDTGDDDAP